MFDRTHKANAFVIFKDFDEPYEFDRNEMQSMASKYLLRLHFDQILIIYFLVAVSNKFYLDKPFMKSSECNEYYKSQFVMK